MNRRLDLRVALTISAIAIFCLATVIVGRAAADTATVVSGFTSPPTLKFRQGPMALADDFTDATLNNCLWQSEIGGNYSYQLTGTTLAVSGSGSGGSNSFAGVALSSADNFSATAYSAQVTISAASASQYGLSLSSKDTNNSSSHSTLDASVFVSNGNYNLSISYSENNVPVAQSSGQVSLSGLPLPYSLSLIVDRTAGTASAKFTSSAGTSTRTINVVTSFTTFSLGSQLSNFDTGTVSADSFTTDLTQPTKYSISDSPLSVFGTDYKDVPFGGPPTLGEVAIVDNSPLLISADNACVTLDGTTDLHSALATFGPFHVTIYTTLDQASINGLAQSNGGNLDCYGSAFTNNGAGNDYTFSTPSCTALADTPTAGPTNTQAPPTNTSVPPSMTPTTTATAVPTNTPTAVPTNTPTAAPTNTATAAPTASTTATVPPPALDLISAALSRGHLGSTRDNGSVSVIAQVDDSPAGGNLSDRVVGGGFSIEVEDADASFHVSFPISGCAKLTNGSAVCRIKGAIKSNIHVLPTAQEGQWQLRVRASGFPKSQTGPSAATSTNPTTPPVTITLHEGGSETSASISNCKPSGVTKLTCHK